MRYIQFLQLSTGWNGKDFSGPKKLIPACGSDGVRIVDGRWSLAHIRNFAERETKRRGYHGFEVWAGQSFTRSQRIWPKAG